MKNKTLVLAGTESEFYDFITAKDENGTTYLNPDAIPIKSNVDINKHADYANGCKFIGTWRCLPHEQTALIIRVLRFYNIPIEML